MRYVLHNYLGVPARDAAAVRASHVRYASRKPFKAEDCDKSCACDKCLTADAGPAEYFVRVDDHLRTLPTPEAKRKFLRDQRDSFERKYADFQRRAARGGSTTPSESAWAYAETIDGLTRRLGQV